jgi:hypothetical protein
MLNGTYGPHAHQNNQHSIVLTALTPGWRHHGAFTYDAPSGSMVTLYVDYAQSAWGSRCNRNLTGVLPPLMHRNIGDRSTKGINAADPSHLNRQTPSYEHGELRTSAFDGALPLGIYAACMCDNFCCDRW